VFSSAVCPEPVFANESFFNQAQNSIAKKKRRFLSAAPWKRRADLDRAVRPLGKMLPLLSAACVCPEPVLVKHRLAQGGQAFLTAKCIIIAQNLHFPPLFSGAIMQIAPAQSEFRSEIGRLLCNLQYLAVDDIRTRCDDRRSVQLHHLTHRCVRQRTRFWFVQTRFDAAFFLSVLGPEPVLTNDRCSSELRCERKAFSSHRCPPRRPARSSSRPCRCSSAEPGRQGSCFRIQAETTTER
jgi:hypothetical protein